MINLYTRNVGYEVRYILGDPETEIAHDTWKRTIKEAFRVWRHAYYYPGHSVFTGVEGRAIICTFKNGTSYEEFQNLYPELLI